MRPEIQDGAIDLLTGIVDGIYEHYVESNLKHNRSLLEIFRNVMEDDENYKTLLATVSGDKDEAAIIRFVSNLARFCKGDYDHGSPFEGSDQDIFRFAITRTCEIFGGVPDRIEDIKQELGRLLTVKTGVAIAAPGSSPVVDAVQRIVGPSPAPILTAANDNAATSLLPRSGGVNVNFG